MSYAAIFGIKHDLNLVGEDYSCVASYENDSSADVTETLAQSSTCKQRLVLRTSQCSRSRCSGWLAWAIPGNLLLAHDGTYGSGLHEWNGDVSTLNFYDTDTRAIPFDVLGKAPKHELIIGSAGGQEILASLFHKAPNIEAVELNPVTVDLLKHKYADFTGHLTENPAVHQTLSVQDVCK